MTRYLVRRLVQATLTVFGVVTAVFFLVELSGDPAALLLPTEATPEDLARLRLSLGLDEPLPVRYLTFLGNAVKGDFGDSFRQRVPALPLVLERLPATIELALSAFLLGIGMAFAASLAVRLTRSERLRTALLWVAFTFQAIPTFFFGLILILVFSVWLGWLPSIGRGGLDHLILPAFSLATFELALYLRLLNSAFLQEQSQDYVRTAYAKGGGRAWVLVRHVLPNALLPIVTIAGINLGVLLGGAIVTETVFSWPGVGRLIVQSVSQRDYPVILAGVFVISLVFVVINLLVDLLYAVLDPRVGYS